MSHAQKLEPKDTEPLEIIHKSLEKEVSSLGRHNLDPETRYQFDLARNTLREYLEELDETWKNYEDELTVKEAYEQLDERLKNQQEKGIHYIGEENTLNEYRRLFLEVAGALHFEEGADITEEPSTGTKRTGSVSYALD